MWPFLWVLIVQWWYQAWERLQREEMRREMSVNLPLPKNYRKVEHGSVVEEGIPFFDYEVSIQMGDDLKEDDPAPTFQQAERHFNIMMDTKGRNCHDCDGSHCAKVCSRGSILIQFRLTQPETPLCKKLEDLIKVGDQLHFMDFSRMPNENNGEIIMHRYFIRQMRDRYLEVLDHSYDVRFGEGPPTKKPKKSMSEWERRGVALEDSIVDRHLTVVFYYAIHMDRIGLRISFDEFWKLIMINGEQSYEARREGYGWSNAIADFLRSLF